MPQNTEEPSQIAPLLVAAVICDVAVEDPSTKKKTLVGIFDTVRASEFPTQRTLTLYVKIVDAIGHYALKVRIVNTSSGDSVGEIDGNVVAQDRLKSTELLIPILDMPIQSKGRYEFQVWFNGMFAGQTFLDAEPLPR